MPYPSSVDAGGSPPWALCSGDIDSYTTAAALATNTAYLVGVYLPAPAILSGMRTRFGSGGAGNFDIGIYNSGGALLWHNGSAATSTGVVTKNLATPIGLLAGAYWLALWMSNATDTVNRITPTANISINQAGTVSTQLPNATSGISSLANNAVKPLLIGLLQGMWS